MVTQFKYEPTVFVIDDEEELLSSLVKVVETMGVAAEGFSLAAEFLENFDPSRHGCLLLDVRMPGMDGLQLQEKLVRNGCKQPIVFITGHADISMCTQAMKSGAVDFLEKPYRVQDLVDAVRNALALDREHHKRASQQQAANDRIACLSPREQVVARCLAIGMTNDEIATEIDVSKRTIERYKSRIMQQLNVTTRVDLVIVFQTAGKKSLWLLTLNQFSHASKH